MEPGQATNIVDRNPAKVSGAWVFRGTRVPVAALFENLRDGATVDEFLEWFPGVTRHQVETMLDAEVASSLAIVVLMSTSWPRIQARVSEIQTAVDSIQPGDYREQPI